MGKPQIPLQTLFDHAEGLFLLTGGPAGPIGGLLAEGQIAKPGSTGASCAEAFPGRIAMELQRHGEKLEQAIEPGMIDAGRCASAPAGRHE